MTHFHITRVLYTTMVGTLMTAALVVLIFAKTFTVYAQVSELSGDIQYGGTTKDTEINVDTIDDLECPVYTNVLNADDSDGLPPVFGVFVLPEYPLPTYDYDNLFTPDCPIIGMLDFEDPCATNDGIAFPLVPDPGNPLFYETGTCDF